MKDKYDFIHGCTSENQRNKPSGIEVATYIYLFIFGVLVGGLLL